MKELYKGALMLLLAVSVLVVVVGFFIPTSTDRIAIIKTLNVILLVICVGFLYLGEEE